MWRISFIIIFGPHNNCRHFTVGLFLLLDFFRSCFWTSWRLCYESTIIFLQHFVYPGEKVEDVHKKRRFQVKFSTVRAWVIKDASQDFFTSLRRSTHQWTTYIKLGKKTHKIVMFIMLGVKMSSRLWLQSQSFFSLVLVFYYLTGWCGRKRSTNDTLAGFVVQYNMFPFTHTFPWVDYLHCRFK